MLLDPLTLFCATFITTLLFRHPIASMAPWAILYMLVSLKDDPRGMLAALGGVLAATGAHSAFPLSPPALSVLAKAALATAATSASMLLLLVFGVFAGAMAPALFYAAMQYVWADSVATRACGSVLAAAVLSLLLPDPGAMLLCYGALVAAASFVYQQYFKEKKSD